MILYGTNSSSSSVLVDFEALDFIHEGNEGKPCSLILLHQNIGSLDHTTQSRYAGVILGLLMETQRKNLTFLFPVRFEKVCVVCKARAGHGCFITMWQWRVNDKWCEFGIGLGSGSDLDWSSPCLLGCFHYCLNSVRLRMLYTVELGFLLIAVSFFGFCWIPPAQLGWGCRLSSGKGLC